MKKTYLFAAAFLSLLLSVNSINAQTLGRLWGMTSTGGDSTNGGVIFNYDVNNSHDSTLRSLPSGAIYPYYNDLVQASDGNFYGMCSGGGIDGVLFKCTPTGQYVNLHDFTGGSADGGNPQGSLIQASDGNLYGMTYEGGTGGAGTIFKCTTAGVLTTLVNFSNSEKPLGNLVQASDGNLYGMTHGGGTSGIGTIFKCTTSGTLTTLVNFTGNSGANPGANPNGSLIQATDGNLYGMTSAGGTSGDGTIFKCSTSGTMTVLVNFTGTNGAAPGATPYGRLLQVSGGTLYGMTEVGGSSGDGVIFSCTTSGTYTELVPFTGSTNGSNPYGSLILGTDGNLYGVTRNGGPTSNGEVFKCTTTGTLTVVKGFSSGIFPYGSLIQATDGNLYGITSVGGSSGLGTVYKCTTGGTLTYIVNFGAFDVGNNPYGSLIQATNGNLYGMTTRGGSPGYGTIFTWANGAMSTLYNFADGADGGEPQGNVIQATDGNLYGMTNDNNNIFRCSTSGSFSNLVTLVAATQGSNLTGSLIQATDGNFYGMANQGGASSDGTIFKCTTAGAVTVLVNFTGGNGANPYGSLMQASDGNLYGMTANGGTSSKGTIFKCTTSGTLTTLVNFNGTNGANPFGNLIQASDGNLYGMTQNGGSGGGIIFKCTTSGTLTTIYTFTSGENPQGSLIQGSDGNLYGMTSGGGSNGTGYVFKCTTSGTLTNLMSLIGNNGQSPVYNNNLLEAMSATITNAPVCANPSTSTLTAVTRGGKGPFTYLWSSGATTSSITGNVAINYTVAVTDSRGIAVGAAITVPTYNLPTVTTSGGNTICNGNSTSITATVSGGTGPFGYVWSPATGLVTPTGSPVVADPSSTQTYTVTVTDANNCTATQVFGLIVNPTPTVSASATNPSICAGNSTPITSTVSGGTAPYTYNWGPSSSLSSGSTQNVTATPGSTTTYTLFATDQNGCVSVVDVPVTVNSLPNVTANFTSSPICLGGNTMLTASGANSYVWSPAATLSASTGTSVTATPTISTTYSVIGTDGNGCQSTGTTPVVVNSLPAVTVAPTTQAVCAGNAAPITASGANTYTWSPATDLSVTTGSNVNASPAATKTYTVVGTNAAGCQNSATAIVTVNALPTVTASASASPICHGSTSTLTASGATTYTWAPSATLNKSTGASVVATPTISTTYTVTGTNASGCTNTGTVAVIVNALPTVTASASASPICNGNTSTLTASGAATYTWTPTATLSASTGTSVVATPTISTTYTVTGTNAAGCANTGTVSVVVNASPTVTTNASSTICIGSNTSLTASGAATYTWTPSTTLSASTGVSVTATPTVSTTYTVSGANAAGCVNTATVSVTVNSLPTVTGSASGSPMCNGSSSTLNASGASTYVWSPNVNLSATTGASVVATPTVSFTYTVTGTNGSGCMNTTTVPVTVNALPTVTVAESPNAICLGNSSTLTATGSGGSAPYLYSWAPATDLSVTTGNIVSASPGTTYTYTVTITDANNCTNTAGAPITVNYAPGLSFTPTSATICSGSNTSIAVSGGSTYVWSPSSSLSCSNCAAVTASPTVNTVYKVTGTSAAGCTALDSVLVSVDPLPTITASASSPTICAGGSSNLTASGGNSYTWAPVTGLSVTTGASVVATPTASVTYTVTGTNVSGCQNTQTVSVTVNALPTVSASAGSNPICKGSPTTVTASGASTYTWSPATGLSATTGASVTANPSSGITYTVTGTDVNGCVSSGILAMSVNSLPTVTANASPTSICSGSTSSLSGAGAVSYVWSPAATLNSSTGTVVTASPTTTTAYTVTGTDGNGCSNTANVVIDVDNPVINLTKTNVSCHGACNGTLLPNVSGGTPPYSYSWSNSQTTALASNLCPATYTLTLTDNLGCSGTKSATITQPGAISVNGSSTATSCGLANGVAIASASGGSAPYNYSWNTSPVQTGNTISNLASGSYSVTVTDGNGCTAGTNVTVGASSGPVISVTSINQSGCGKNDGNATISVTGGTSPYIYSWNNGGTTAMDTGLSAGTYIATVTDNNGCSTFHAITISDASAPTINVTTLTNISCYGASSGAISTNVTGGTPPYQYSWSNSATTQNISGLTAGPYQFTVADANGCTAVQTINITQPNELIASTAATAASCGSSDGSVSVTVSGGTTPYTYSWNTGATTSALSNSGAGTYTVTVTDKNGCSAVTQASISNTSGPLVTIDSVVSISCATGATGEITETANGGTPPYTYAWSNGATTSNIYGLSAGNYALTVTDNNGCIGTANATITEAVLDTIPICIVTVDPATNYNNLEWNPGLASAKVASFNIYKETTTPGLFGKIGSAPASAGLYVDTLSDARKRSWRYELSQVDSCGVESPLSKPFKTMHLTINIGASNSINLIWDNFQGIAFNYYIVFRDSVAGVAQDSIDYVTNNGIFTYTDFPPTNKNWYYHMGISGQTNCSGTGHKPQSIESINYNASKSNTGNIIFVNPTAVENISSVNSLNIYPNPTRGVFNMDIDMNKQQDMNVKIYNTLGQVIEEENYNRLNGKVTKQFDLSDYGKGIYIIKISTESGVEYRKVAIQ